MPNEKKIATFSKQERLKSKKTIEKLFNRNDSAVKSYVSFPYKAVYFVEMETLASYPEILISVPKRNFKKAVDRNRIKRLTREAYRTQKLSFSNKIYLGLIYIGKRLPDFRHVQKSMNDILSQITRDFQSPEE